MSVPVKPLPEPIPTRAEPPQAPAEQKPLRWQKITAYALALLGLGVLPPETHQWVVAMFGTLVVGNGVEHWAKRFLGNG